MEKITLKQMRYVCAVEKTGHFGRAAKACNVTQPALSQQISQLEAMCGGQLFERGQKPIRPTPFGQEFISQAKTILADAQNLSDFALSHSGIPSAPIRFGLIPTIAPYLLPKMFPPLLEKFSTPGFNILEGQTENLQHMLEKGDLDMALIATAPPKGGVALSAIPLFSDPFVLAAPTRTNLKQPVHLSDLPKDQLLLLDEGHCFRDQMIKACALDKEQTSNNFSATSLSTIMAFVANAQGLTLLPAISIEKEASDPRIKLLKLAPPVASRTLSLVFRKNTPFKTLFENIAAEIIQSAKTDKTANLLFTPGPEPHQRPA